MGIRYSLNQRELGERTEAFFALRIGTGQHNDIVIANGSPGVHENHCTIVSTGSTYRLEMRPEHLVYVDGGLGECGGQLFQKNVKSCELQMGSANAIVRLTRTGGNIEPKTVFNRGRRLRNRDSIRDHRRMIQVICGSLVVFALLGIIAFNRTTQADKIQKANIEILESGTVSKQEREVAFRSIVQLGLIAFNGDEPDKFLPVGTGWILLEDGSKTLVTNIHVIGLLDPCVSQPDDCSVIPKALKTRPFEIGVRLYGRERPVLFSKFVGCANHQACWKQGRFKLHPHYSKFDRQISKGAILRKQYDIKNIYDVALYPIEATGNDGSPNLNIAATLPGLEFSDRAPFPGDVASMIGFPTENDLGAEFTSTPLYRTVYVGRVSSPFGVGHHNSQTAHHIVLTGASGMGGDSGGPIINGNGDVVAMTFASFFEVPDTSKAKDLESSGDEGREPIRKQIDQNVNPKPMSRKLDGSSRAHALSFELIQEITNSNDPEDREEYWNHEIAAFDKGGFKHAGIASRWFDECVGEGVSESQRRDTLDYELDVIAPIVKIEGANSVDVSDALDGVSPTDLNWYADGTVKIDLRRLDQTTTRDSHKMVIIASSRRTEPDEYPSPLAMSLFHPVSKIRIETWDLVSSEQLGDIAIAKGADPEVSIAFEINSAKRTLVEFEVRRLDCSARRPVSNSTDRMTNPHAPKEIEP